jgi:hypothetical protein
MLFTFVWSQPRGEKFTKSLVQYIHLRKPVHLPYNHKFYIMVLEGTMKSESLLDHENRCLSNFGSSDNSRSSDKHYELLLAGQSLCKPIHVPEPPHCTCSSLGHIQKHLPSSSLQHTNPTLYTIFN